ncbi:MAG: ATP-binding cassette domain-containing protein [Propionibacteriales bacterium]|nr:ATP-binding cassette domain-containing protein [Propionibacteriales bacterium]
MRSDLMADPIMVVEDYSFWFELSEDREALALRDVSFEVEQGDFLLILGKSGSGKSTLALNLVGIYPDYFGGRNEGRILVNHATKGLINRRELDRGERFATVNMLFQNPEDQIVTLTVEEEIGFALENYLFPRDEIHRRIDTALDLVGLTGFRERSTTKLSGGEKQRVALASMLAMEPRVLILDEPTSNLDPVGTHEVLDAINRVRERGDVTLMVVEHEVDTVYDQVNKVLLVDGQTVHGPKQPREFMAEHGLDVRDRMGLWIPQACEVGLELQGDGVELPFVPLNGKELVETLTATGMPRPTGGEPEPRSVVTEQTPGEVVIEVRDLCFSYPSKADVLRNVNLEVRRGELLAIVGQNGSGKSTLAQQFNGIYRPTSGEVLVEGTPTTRYRFADLVRRVAFIFQVPEKQFIRRSVRDEVAHGLKALKVPDEEIDERVETFLRSVRLWDRRDASPYVLSQGQKRRLSVACMVIGEPDVVVLDEPTFGQDHQQAQRLMGLLRELARQGAAVTFITHDMRLVAQHADRCVAMCEGETIFDGTPSELFSNPDVMARAKLRVPPLFEFSRQLLGTPLLDADEARARIKEAIGGRSRARL